MKIMRSITIILLVFFSVLMINACDKGPECGNFKIEEGETSATCCLDAGCIGGQTCVDNTCKDPTCGESQYLDTEKHTCNDNPACEECQYIDTEKHTCNTYACCNDSKCAVNEECLNHECKEIICGDCEYIENHECKPLICCDDLDCNDKNSQTLDSCKFPSTKSAQCVHASINECEVDADCNDNNKSTEDQCSSGTPHTCRNSVITECSDDDSYCPEDCNYKDDDDCEEAAIKCEDNDLDCFNDALDDCLLAELTLTVDNSTNDIEMEITTYMQIEDENADDECEVSFETKEVTLDYTRDYKNELEDDGYTDDEIDDMETEAQEDAADAEGNDWTCYFEDPDDLTDILNDWDDGDYSIESLTGYGCEGDNFD